MDADADEDAKARRGCLTWLGIAGLHLAVILLIRECEERQKPKPDDVWRKILRPADK
ncbi:MAG: hypothetical protein JO055_06765 [Alphaproteobacteria bacterium]|nr:hypothetical protein [Alphaproteobacteria bacterium]